MNLGGKGANQAVAARRLGRRGADARLRGRRRRGGEIRARLAALGIGVDGLVTAPAPPPAPRSSSWTREGANQIAVAPGANHALTVEMARPCRGAIAWAEVVVCQLEMPLPVVRWALEEARRHGRRHHPQPGAGPGARPTSSSRSLTTSRPTRARRALAGVEVTGLETARQAAERLVERGRGLVIVTLGEQGALVCGGERAVHFRPSP